MFLNCFLEIFTLLVFSLFSSCNPYYLEVEILGLNILKKIFSLTVSCSIFWEIIFQCYPPSFTDFLISAIIFLILRAIFASVPFSWYPSVVSGTQYFYLSEELMITFWFFSCTVSAFSRIFLLLPLLFWLLSLSFMISQRSSDFWWSSLTS